jgi:hypothetical protein
MTVCFHVDDCKLSHRDPKVMDDMIGWLKKEYEHLFEDGSGTMTVSRGKVYKYLGMQLDYTIRGIVKISMLEFVDEIDLQSRFSSTWTRFMASYLSYVQYTPVGPPFLGHQT